MNARHKTTSAIGEAYRKGVAAVEFAIVASLLVLIVGGVIEFGRLLWYFDTLTKATRDGARFVSTAAPKSVILTSDTTGIPAAKTLVANAANAANLSPALISGNVSVTCQNSANATVDCDNAVVEYVRVGIINYPVILGSWFPMPFPSVTWDMTLHTTMRYMCSAGATSPC